MQYAPARFAVALAALLAAGLGAPPARPAPGAPLGPNASLGGRRPFPDDNPWNQDISREPLDPRSAALIRRIGAETPLHPDFGDSFGKPYVVVAGTQAKVPVTFGMASESDPGPYPVPPGAPVEEGNDRHVLVVDRDNWRLYELYGAGRNGSGWRAASGAVFDLGSNRRRPEGWTSADAAGLPIFPGLVRYDEAVEQGEIRHALRFTVRHTRRGYVPPATHFAGSGQDPETPPMGMRVRLKAGFDDSGFPACARAILRVLKTYGMFVADHGSNWYLSGAPDRRWDNDALRTLRRVRGRDFEVVRMPPVVEDED